MERDELQQHIYSTYVNQRHGMALITLVFPALLYIVGKFNGIPLENSMSAYYFAPTSNPTEQDFPVRVWFVGILFALGIFFYLYKGFSEKENIALNIAGVFAIGVAIFPMDRPPGDASRWFSLHGFSAVMVFLCIAFVSIWCAKDTLYLLKDETLENRYKKIYATLGGLMIASPVIAFILTLVFQKQPSYIFFVEAAGVWTFAAYWSVKSTELEKSSAEQRALAKEI